MRRRSRRSPPAAARASTRPSTRRHGQRFKHRDRLDRGRAGRHRRTPPDESVGVVQLGPTAVGGTPGGGTTPPGGGTTTRLRAAAPRLRRAAPRLPTGGGTPPTGDGTPTGGTVLTANPVTGIAGDAGAGRRRSRWFRRRTGRRRSRPATRGPVAPAHGGSVPAAHGSGRHEEEHPCTPGRALVEPAVHRGLALWIALVIAGGLLRGRNGLEKARAAHAVAARTRGLRMRPEAPRLPV